MIYYFHNETFPLFLLTVYAKNQKSNLTRAERAALKALVPVLVQGGPFDLDRLFAKVGVQAQ